MYVKYNLSHDVAPGSEITSCFKIDKPLVISGLSGNVMTSYNITYITCNDKIILFLRQK